MGGRFNRENWREYIRRFNENDEETTVQAVPNEKAEEWVEREVPFFDCPDPVLEETWYFRWWVFPNISKIPDGAGLSRNFFPWCPGRGRIIPSTEPTGITLRRRGRAEAGQKHCPGVSCILASGRGAGDLLFFLAGRYRLSVCTGFRGRSAGRGFSAGTGFLLRIGGSFQSDKIRSVLVL